MWLRSSTKRQPVASGLKGARRSVATPRRLASLACCSVLAVSGCGSNGNQLETAPVSGIVTVDGQPATSGYVFIVPAKGRMAKGAIKPDGTFEMSTYAPGDGVQVGSHPVTVSPIPPGEGTPKPKGKAVEIPIQYAEAGSSGLTATVEAGEANELKLELSSEPS